MATSELSVPGPLSMTPQAIQDEADTSSAVQISTQGLLVTRASTPNLEQRFLINVQAPSDIPAASVQIQSASPEASLRFLASGSPSAYHIGVGGGAGTDSFFIWHVKSRTESHQILGIAPDGQVTIFSDVTIKGKLTVIPE